MKKITLLSMALLAGAFASNAADLGYSYASADGGYELIGTAKKETMNMAIYVGGGAVGMEIKAITVPVVPTDGIENLSVWVADKLSYANVNGKNQNVTDYSVDAEYPTEGTAEVEWISVELPEPYVVPEGGTYVGYSFDITTLTDAAKNPLVVAEGSTDNACYIYTSRTYRNWTDRGSELNARLMIQVTLEGEVPDYAIKLGAIPSIYLGADETSEVNVDVYNSGLCPVESMDYTVEVAGQSVQGVMTFDTPLEANLALKNSVEFTVPAVPEPGDYPLTITISAVNGIAYETSSTGTVGVIWFVPEHLSVVEEYTGTWCGYCPRGFVAMEEMNRLYPNFVGIAYHNGDPMTSPDGDPGMVGGYPGALIDRAQDIDPYYADSQYGSGFTLPEAWEAACDAFTLARLEVEAEIPEDDENSVVVNSTVTFAASVSDAETANYRVEMVLCGDGITDESWGQSNYYYSYSPFYLMEEFCSGGEYGSSKVYGLVFNDVALLNTGITGIQGSVPNPDANVPNEYQHVFDLTTAVSPYNSELIPFHRDQLDVVVMLLKGSGKGTVENSIKVPVKTTTGVKNISTSNREVESEVYYDLQGRIVRNPENGVFIHSVRYTDGSVANSKVVK